MPIPFDQIQSIAQEWIVPKLVDNLFKDNLILARFRANDAISVDDAEHVKLPIIYASTSTAQSYSKTDVFSLQDVDTFTAAKVDWKFYKADVVIFGPDEVRSSGTINNIFGFVNAKRKLAESQL